MICPYFIIYNNNKSNGSRRTRHLQSQYLFVSHLPFSGRSNRGTDSLQHSQILRTSLQSNPILIQIKTKIEKVFEVKPTKGFLLPGDKAVISFKAINKLVKLPSCRMKMNVFDIKKISNSCCKL